MVKNWQQRITFRKFELPPIRDVMHDPKLRLTMLEFYNRWKRILSGS